METARFRFIALVIGICVVSLMGPTHAANAQCVPTGTAPSGGPSQIPNCDDNSGGHADASYAFTIGRVPLHVFVRNPILATMTWVMTRPQGAARPGDALFERSRPSRTLRGGRTPKQVAW
jgi:hypothetical protein